jgi:COMPASS component SWD1
VAAASGHVYIWATNYTENWSAFAPDFKELEENEEYTEREDEFDIVSNPPLFTSLSSFSYPCLCPVQVEEREQQKRQEQDEHEEVDIMTVEHISAFSSDEEDDLFFLPTIPQRDIIVGSGGVGMGLGGGGNGVSGGGGNGVGGSVVAM